MHTIPMQMTDHGHAGHNKPILETPYLKRISSWTFLEKVTIANKRQASRGFCLSLGAKHIYSCGEPGLQHFTTTIRKGFCLLVCRTYSSFPGNYSLYIHSLLFLQPSFSLQIFFPKMWSYLRCIILFHHIQAPLTPFSFWIPSLKRNVINHDQ